MTTKTRKQLLRYKIQCENPWDQKFHLMFTINNYNYVCSRNCRNREHGEKIAKNVLHRKNTSDEKLAACIAKTCKNFAGIEFEVPNAPLIVETCLLNFLNFKGLTILHLLCSKQRHAVIEWILNYVMLFLEYTVNFVL